MSKICYLEFLFPIRDYLETTKLNEYIYEWGTPLIVTCLTYILFYKFEISINYISFSKYIAGIMAILIGFSMASVTILSTASGKTIALLKKQISKRAIGNKYITVYRWMLVNFTFALFGEIASLVFVSLLYAFKRCGTPSILQHIVFGLNVWLVVHVVLLNIRNVTNFYLVFARGDLDKSPPPA